MGVAAPRQRRRPRPPQRQARPTYDGPAACQCRARSVTRSGWSSSASATRACTRARRVAVSPAARVSRTRAWAKREALDADVAHQAGRLGRLDDVEQVVLVDAGRPRQGRRVEAAADHRGVRRAPTVALGQPGEPADQHLLHAGRRVLLGEQAGQVGALAGQPGVLHDVERVAVGALLQGVGLVGRRPVVRHGREHLRHGVGGRGRSRLRRTACRRASASATSASAAGRLGVVAPGDAAPAAARPSPSRRAAAGPAGCRGRPSGGRRAPTSTGSLAGRVADGAHDPLERPELVAVVLGAVSGSWRRGPPAPAPTATAAAHRRPASTARRRSGHRRARATVDELRGQARLADPGLAGEHGVRRGAGRARGPRPRRARRGRRRGRPSASRPRRGAPAGCGLGTGGDERGARAAAAAATHSSEGSCRSTAVWRSRSSGARLDPELLVQQVAHLAEHLQGVGLTPGTGQRERPQHPRAARAAGARRSSPPGRRPRSRGDRARARRPRGPRAPPGAAPRGGSARRPPGARRRARRTACRATARARRPAPPYRRRGRRRRATGRPVLRQQLHPAVLLVDEALEPLDVERRPEPAGGRSRGRR